MSDQGDGNPAGEGNPLDANKTMSRLGFFPTGQNGEQPTVLSDAELLQRHLTGNRQAFAELIGRYRVDLYGFLARFTGDATLAEDVFQETFLQLHISAAAFDPARRLKPWLFTIAANKARDAMRSRARRQAAPLDAPLPGRGDGQTTYAEIMPADIPRPDESLVNIETRQAVRTIVEEMPVNLRSVLLLNYFHNCSYKDISEILAVPLGTIKSRLHAAVKYFAQRWHAAAGPGGQGQEK